MMESRDGTDNPTSTSCMYRSILKELGAEDSHTMEYLFQETSSEEEDDQDMENDDLDKDDKASNGNSHAIKDSNKKTATWANVLEEYASDEDLLHQWESEEENDNDRDLKLKTDEASTLPSIDDELPQKGKQKMPEWKSMLQEAAVQQKELMIQLMNLQMVQKESRSQENANKPQSPHTPIVTGVMGDKPQESSNNDPQASSITSPLLQEVSIRNLQLQDEWQSQQVQTVKLQDKLNALQTQYNQEQDEWKKEQKELFSPLRSPTKIPRWEPNLSASKANDTVYSSAAMPKNGNRVINGNIELRDPKSPESQTLVLLLKQREDRVLELEAQLETCKNAEIKKNEQIQTLQKSLEQRDVHIKDLMLQHETEKTALQESIQEIRLNHENDKTLWKQNLENANDKVQKQVEVNQDLREEVQRLKADSWKNDLEETQNRIKDAIQQQAVKAQEFQSRIKELENRHEVERRNWKNQLEEYEVKFQESADEWESSLQEADERYKSLEDRYIKETKEWQMLLEMDMSKTFEEEGDRNNILNTVDKKAWDDPTSSNEGHSVALLSPILQTTSKMTQSDNEFSMEDSSIQINTVPSESLEKIDDLLDELGVMNAERTAILNEINGLNVKEDNAESTSSVDPLIMVDVKAASASDGPPMPVDSPRCSPVRTSKESNDALNTTNDSVVLDQTLSLLRNLKDMITCNGDGSEQETSVLERLEVLSELMQDQASFQSLVSSPRRGSAGVNQSQLTENEHSLQVSKEDESENMASSDDRNVSWFSTFETTVNPWAELVAELKSRCEFLERDRADLARITEQIIQMERESHKVEVEAGVATAKREANEQLYQAQHHSDRQLRNIYRSLCVHCQRRVYTAV